MTIPNNIYGFSCEIKSQGQMMTAEAVKLITDIKASTWRVQVPAKHIMDPKDPSKVDWSLHDAIYKLAEAAGLQLVLTLEDFDPAYNLAPGYTDPKVMAAFGATLAKRYPNLYSIECGNEEIDGKNLDWKYMAEQIVATAPAIRAVNTKTLIGSGAFVGYHNSVAHITESITALWTGGAAPLVNYIQAHFYHGDGISPTQSDGKEPAFKDVWGTIQAVNTAHGHPHKPIWIGEVNWTLSGGGTRNPQNVVSESTQWTYLQAVLDEARLSGVVQKVLIYTIGGVNDGMSLASVKGTTTAYQQLGQYIAAHP